MKSHRAVLAFLGLGLAMMMLPSSEACSCLPQHPQTAFCDSEYVIVAQVLRKTAAPNSYLNAYKIAIKKEYKMSDEARKLLAHGKLVTASMSSMCGVTLQPGMFYVIAANSDHVGLCDFIHPYGNLTAVEKRGLAGIYRKGCKCKIQQCMGGKCKARDGACLWSPFEVKGPCETSYGSCVPNGIVLADGTPKRCHWRKSPRFGQCVMENMAKSGSNGGK